MIKDGFTFDDVLLTPKFSRIESRSTVDLSVSLDGGAPFIHPIIPANMKTVTGRELAVKACQLGGLAILHRFMDPEEQFAIVEDMIHEHGFADNFAVSVGVKPEDKGMISRFASLGVKTICIDIAHGDSQQCLDVISWVKFRHSNLRIIAGNVATGEGATRLWEAGADIVKVGIGPGSLCTTRIETGNGVPQLTALMEVAEAQRSLEDKTNWEVSDYPSKKFPFIADGGIKNAGDIVKALCFADMVMVGNLFAGCLETPGNIIRIDGRPYKEYVGSSTHKTNHVEGVAAMVSYKGEYENILAKLLEGLRSGCSYQGAKNLSELKRDPHFVKITSAGLKESHPHDVMVTK